MTNSPPTICVITPTIGRATLKRAIKSVWLEGDQWSGDQWIIIPDGCNAEAKNIWRQLQPERPYLRYFDRSESAGDYGNPLRDLAMSLSINDYFVFLDDDDIFVPGAIDIIKQEIVRHTTPSPIMFRMISNGEIIWKGRDVTPGNVGGSMFCVPNDADKLGVWTNGAGHRSDYEFIRGTLAKYGSDWRKELIWSGDVIIHCRPGNEA